MAFSFRFESAEHRLLEQLQDIFAVEVISSRFYTKLAAPIGFTLVSKPGFRIEIKGSLIWPSHSLYMVLRPWSNRICLYNKS